MSAKLRQILEGCPEIPTETKDGEEEEEDDYMSMAIVEPSKTGGETLTQKRLRKQRESERKARVLSKSEREAEEAARREAALATSAFNPSSKGFQMMAKLGFKPGSALGKDASTDSPTSGVDEWNRRLTEPLGISMKEGRGGIGMDSEKKRKFREQMEEEVKKVKTEEVDYRERVRLEREERRQEAQFHSAQKVAERLDLEAEEHENRDATSKENNPANGDEETEETTSKKKVNTKPTLQTNILYRGLVRAREEKHMDQQAQRRRYESLASHDHNAFSKNIYNLPTHADEDLDPDEKLAFGRNTEGEILEVECDLEEDPELEEFNALSPGERLRRLVVYLRERHRYCFWCKHSYDTDEMEGCPGLTEEDHD